MMTAMLHRPGRITAEPQESAPVQSGHPVPANQLQHRLSVSGLAWQQVRRAPATIG